MLHTQQVGKPLIAKTHKSLKKLKTELYIQLQKLIDRHGPTILHKVLYGTSQKGMRRFRKQYRSRFVFRTPEPRRSKSPIWSSVLDTSDSLCERCKTQKNGSNAQPTRQTRFRLSKDEDRRGMVWEIGIIKASIRRLQANYALMDRTGRFCQNRRLRSSNPRKGLRAPRAEIIPSRIAKTTNSEQGIHTTLKWQDTPEASKGLNLRQPEASNQYEIHSSFRSDFHEFPAKKQAPYLRKKGRKMNLSEDFIQLRRVSAMAELRPTIQGQVRWGADDASQDQSIRNIDANGGHISASGQAAETMMASVTTETKMHARALCDESKVDETAGEYYSKNSIQGALNEARDTWTPPALPNKSSRSLSSLAQSDTSHNFEFISRHQSKESVMNLPADFLVSYFQAESFLIIERAKLSVFSVDAIFAEIDITSRRTINGVRD